MEVRSSGSSKGNPDRSPALLPLKIFRNRDIGEGVKTGGIFQSRNTFEISEKPFSCHPALNLIQGISGSQILNLIQDIDFMRC
jgi:hypothetical protein